MTVPVATILSVEAPNVVWLRINPELNERTPECPGFRSQSILPLKAGLVEFVIRDDADSGLELAERIL